MATLTITIRLSRDCQLDPPDIRAAAHCALNAIRAEFDTQAALAAATLDHLGATPAPAARTEEIIKNNE